ncbi:MAG: hypothetical protein M1819_004364 [Sarea resinae]|nr:MAG: hypothetical protein M1819_004364 [Sarea resinae]
MAEGGRHGNPEEELFLPTPATDLQTPTVAPLRINKGESVSPPPASTTGPSSTPPAGFAQPSGQRKYPRVPGPTAPLPYPDHDYPRPQYGSANEGLFQPPYPDRDRLSGSAQGRSSPHFQSQSPPPRTGTADSGRSSIGSYSATPRLGEHRDGQQPPMRLAERRGNVPKPLPDSPGPEPPDKEGLFQRPPRRSEQSQSPDSQHNYPSRTEADISPQYHQQYWPPPTTNPNAGVSGLSAPTPSSVNRLASTSSTHTTRAQRGSPPPPETPATGPGDQPGAGIEARYAAAGIAGAGTLTGLQAQSAAAAQRANQYPQQPQQRQRPSPQDDQQQQQQGPQRRPWTPTELPGSEPHGPPTVYQGSSEVSDSPTSSSGPQLDQQTRPGSEPPQHDPLEHDFQRMHMTSSPPPAYSDVSQQALGSTTAQGYPNEKRAQPAGGSAAPPVNPVNEPAAGPSQQDGAVLQGHPAFANDPRQQSTPPTQEPFAPIKQQFANASPGPGAGAGPASPPLLPEGWIAHMDPSSGQYYYIHLPTQSTQWEFPKGPTPLNFADPASPTMSTYGGNPLVSPAFSTFSGTGLGSPGFPSKPGGYAESIMSMASTPTAAGFSMPPPSAGVDVYRVAPTNGVYFGPYLRYTNMDLERGLWLGSILLVTDAPQPPTIHIHQTVDLSPNPRQLKPFAIYSHQRWVFYRYDVDLRMEDAGSAKWTYAITSHLGCTRYEFVVAGRHETNWRFIAHSGNDFSLNVNANERQRVGGIGFMWKDIMQKHMECGGFHAQLGMGDQIYADRLWKEVPLLRQWLAMSGKDNRRNAPWSAKHEEDVTHAYFHYYSSHFDQPHLREAFAQIPHILQIDDHDIFDGFGSYPEYMQFSHMFKNIGRIGIEMYLLFQHHTTLEILRNVSNDQDLFTITGTGWHFVKYLGPAVVVVGPDCRSERNPHQVMAGPTYQGLFPKVALLPPSVQHCIWMISVPIIYPRLESAETIVNTVATGKKAVTGAYNMLGKMTSSVAGVVGAKQAVGTGFDSIKKAVGKSGLMGGIISPFGDIDMLDELRDQWTHESKDLERTYLIRTLQGIARQKSLRMTFFSGDVGCCGAGLVHDPGHPSDHKTMYQIISSSVVNTPPPSYVVKMLHTGNKPLYVPANGHRSTNNISDTKEDMLEIFQIDVNGAPKETKKLMGRRNYVACVAYDPEVVNGTFGPTGLGKGGGRLSLAVDFMVQNEGVYGLPVKYGPVIIPSLEYGR